MGLHWPPIPGKGWVGVIHWSPMSGMVWVGVTHWLTMPGKEQVRVVHWPLIPGKRWNFSLAANQCLGKDKSFCHWCRLLQQILSAADHTHFSFHWPCKVFAFYPSHGLLMLGYFCSPLTRGLCYILLTFAHGILWCVFHSWSCNL